MTITPYTYQIKLTFQEDLDNWLDVVKDGSNYGYNWRDSLTTPAARAVFDAAQNASTARARQIINRYLRRYYRHYQEALANYRRYLNNSYRAKFPQACEALEQLTGKKLVVTNYRIEITTFPRAPYNYQTGQLFQCLGWYGPIANFMHEALHFQFHHLWRDQADNPVSKLSETDFHDLKEALTVILDERLSDVMEYPDRGYDHHQQLRAKLHQRWQGNQNFEALVEYGLTLLPLSHECD